jgi:hypothetical protein
MNSWLTKLIKLIKLTEPTCSVVLSLTKRHIFWICPCNHRLLVDDLDVQIGSRSTSQFTRSSPSCEQPAQEEHEDYEDYD